MIWAIHGFTGSPSVWSAIQAIPDSQCLTVLGHGSASIAQGDESFASEASRLAALLPEQVPHLVGYSLGARLALAIAIRSPSRIAKLSLIGVQPGLQDKVERQSRLDADREWGKRLRHEGIEAFVEAWQGVPLWQSQVELPMGLLERQQRQRLQHDPLQLALAMDCLGTGVMPPMWHELAKLSMPVQLIVGEHDTKYFHIAQAMLPTLALGNLEFVEASGHNPVLENPTALARLLLDPPFASRAAL